MVVKTVRENCVPKCENDLARHPSSSIAAVTTLRGRYPAAAVSRIPCLPTRFNSHPTADAAASTWVGLASVLRIAARWQRVGIGGGGEAGE